MTQVEIKHTVHRSTASHHAIARVQCNPALSQNSNVSRSHPPAGIGPGMDAIRIATEQGYAGEVTALVSRAHKAGLDVHPYTFRAEYVDLKWNYAVDLYKVRRRCCLHAACS